MTLGYSRRISTILIIAIIALQLVLISDNLKPVKASDKKILQKLKKIGALLFLLKSKSKAQFFLCFFRNFFCSSKILNYFFRRT